MNVTASPNTLSPTITWISPGDITSTTANAVHAAIERVTQERDWEILDLDLRATRLIDSKGLNAIVSAIKAAQARGRRVRLLAAQPSVRRILAFTRIDRHAEVVDAPGARP